MSARDEVLRRVREAVRAAPAAGAPSDVPTEHRRFGEHAPGTLPLVALLMERLVDYRAEVVRCRAGDEAIGEAVRDVATRHRAARLVVAPGLPEPWRPDGAVVDDGLSPAELDALDGVVTASAVAIAETGTIVLDGSPDCGRRAITLVPDLHVCVVRVSDTVQTVPEGLALLEPTRPLTFISGPSATSDIELDRVEGVHGPRTLVVVLAG
ncbi:MAG: LutC/YkgG family protein [Angustibacter sp.]